MRVEVEKPSVEQIISVWATDGVKTRTVLVPFVALQARWDEIDLVYVEPIMEISNCLAEVQSKRHAKKLENLLHSYGYDDVEVVLRYTKV